MKKLLFVLTGIMLSLQMVAQNSDDIIGTWWNEAKTTKIKVEKWERKFVGTVVYIKTGAPAQDTQNPEKNLQGRPILKLRILNELEYDAAKSEWINGKIYDPNVGKIYDCSAWLDGDNTLKLKGYVAGLKLLWRKTTWTRTTL